MRLFSESLAVPLTTGVLLLVLDRRPTRRVVVATGLLLGAAVLVRPSSLFLFPGVLVAWIAATGWRRGLATTAVATGIAVLCVAPWTVRNAVVGDGFVPVSIQSAALYCTFNEVAARDEVFPYACQILTPGALEVLQAPRSDVAFADALREQALDYIADNPLSVPQAFFWNGLSRLWDVRNPARAGRGALRGALQNGDRGRPGHVPAAARPGPVGAVAPPRAARAGPAGAGRRAGRIGGVHERIGDPLPRAAGAADRGAGLFDAADRPRGRTVGRGARGGAVTATCCACGAGGLVADLRVAGYMDHRGLAPTTEAFGVALSDLVRCTTCGHRQLERMPSDAALGEAYGEAASDDYIGEEAGQRETARRALARIERWVPGAGAPGPGAPPA
ncbi:MAG: hypothetical protein M3459_09565, partial [Actinomycetota bacterium]|nr:hypothetical protein [Actinomycetota bacterium]